MKYTDEFLINLCKEKGLNFLRTEIIFLNGKNRRCCFYSCKKHVKYGEQCKPVERIDSTKQPCIYCNHSNLKLTINDEINSSIELEGEYVDFETPIPCRCKIHNERWNGLPSVLLSGGTGCIKCIGEKRWNTRGRRTTEEAKRILESINPNLKVCGEYKGAHEYIDCFCKKHNIMWSSIFCNLQNGSATCPLCALESQLNATTLSDEEITERISVSHPHIIYKGHNNGIGIPSSFFCKIHNLDFIAKPRYLLYGKIKGCPYCVSSLGESKLYNYLSDMNINYKAQHIFEDCRYEAPLRFDAYDLDNNIAYEYQGQQHYYPINFGNMTDEQAQYEFKKNQIRDNIKRQYCSNNNIPLIEIPYWEYDNMINYINKELNKIK